jgi:hypothetical protein
LSIWAVGLVVAVEAGIYRGHNPLGRSVRDGYQVIDPAAGGHKPIN